MKISLGGAVAVAGLASALIVSMHPREALRTVWGTAGSIVSGFTAVDNEINSRVNPSFAQQLRARNERAAEASARFRENVGALCVGGAIVTFPALPQGAGSADLKTLLF